MPDAFQSVRFSTVLVPWVLFRKLRGLHFTDEVQRKDMNPIFSLDYVTGHPIHRYYLI